jgi:threonine dehydrogenase-like Zn-dependent dehydrogenase
LAPVANCFKLPDGIDPATAALIEPLACAVRGFDVLPSGRLATNYLIYDAGTIGLMLMELAKRAGAIDVSVVDLYATRLETAKLLGCTAAVTNSAEPRGWDVGDRLHRSPGGDRGRPSAGRPRRHLPAVRGVGRTGFDRYADAVAQFRSGVGRKLTSPLLRDLVLVDQPVGL